MPLVNRAFVDDERDLRVIQRLFELLGHRLLGFNAREAGDFHGAIARTKDNFTCAVQLECTGNRGIVARALNCQLHLVARRQTERLFWHQIDGVNENYVRWLDHVGRQRTLGCLFLLAFLHGS